MPTEPRILVIRRRYLGDVVLLGSLFRNLRLHWPDARIWALVEPSYADVLGMNTDVNGVLSLPARAADWPSFASDVRKMRFSHVLDLDNTEKTAVVARLTGAKSRVALHHGDHPIRLRACYTHVVHDPGPEHESRPITDYYLRALDPIGVPVVTREIRLHPLAADVAEWRRYVGAMGRTLLVHPGSRSSWRLWPADRFAAVCDRVQDELGVQVVLVGGPGDLGTVAEIRRLARSHILTPDRAPTVPHFAALAKACTALLCHDSGPMHVAASVGTPVIALYGSQNPLLFRPQGKGHTLLVPPMPCANCVAPKICIPADSYRNFCVRQHSVEEVFASAKSVLGT